MPQQLLQHIGAATNMCVHVVVSGKMYGKDHTETLSTHIWTGYVTHWLQPENWRDVAAEVTERLLADTFETVNRLKVTSVTVHV